MTRRRRALVTASLAGALAAACAAEQRATGDTALLRVALDDWQEGPTDGRVCLDARAVPAGASAPGDRWADSVLTVLLADPGIALDTTNGPVEGPRGAPDVRHCGLPGARWVVALGEPQRRGDTADVATTARLAAHGIDTAHAGSNRLRLARVGGRWAIVDHLDMHFTTLGPGR